MATVAENLQTIIDSTEAIKQAIIDKGGTISGGLTTYADAIKNISGGASQEPNMPIIGDGKTYLYITLSDDNSMCVPLYFSQTVSNGVTIDWGDGSTTETISGTGNKNTEHIYASTGEYCISLSVSNGCTLGLGHASSSYCVLGPVANTNKVYTNMLSGVELGNGMTSIKSNSFRLCTSLINVHIPDNITLIDGSAFYNCYSLQKIVIPDSVGTIMNYAFSECYSLQEITLSKNLKTLGISVFSNCRSLKKIDLPTKLTTIKSNTFSYCYSLSSLVIPSGVASIGAGAFSNCYCVKLYDFSQCSSIPTLANTNAFTNIPSDCKIIVPDNLYDSWIAATNWSTYTGYIIRKSDWDAAGVGGSFGGSED